jgi:hypothetical protein
MVDVLSSNFKAYELSKSGGSYLKGNKIEILELKRTTEMKNSMLGAQLQFEQAEESPGWTQMN